MASQIREWDQFLLAAVVAGVNRKFEEKKEQRRNFEFGPSPDASEHVGLSLSGAIRSFGVKSR